MEPTQSLVMQPSQTELIQTGSLKWTGITKDNGEPTLGAWVADMDFGTAPAVEHRLTKAIHSGLLGYPPKWANENVVETLVSFQAEYFGWNIKPSWVRPYHSVLHAFRETIEHLTRPGSPIVVPTPAYMPFLTIPRDHGRRIIEVPSLHDPAATTSEDAWALDLAGIERALVDGAGMVILCNPWNPTGRVLTVPELQALHAVVSKYDALIFSDEIHSPLTYAGGSTFTSYASLGQEFGAHTVTAVAASKAWNIAGLPASQVILPDRALRNRWDQKVPQNSPITLASVATIAAFEEESRPWLSQVIDILERNLDLLEVSLQGTAVDFHRPQGTYLTWLGFEAYSLDRSPSEILREDYGVATNEGITLGSDYGQWARVNAAMSEAPWHKTVERIAQFAKSAQLKG